MRWVWWLQLYRRYLRRISRRHARASLRVCQWLHITEARFVPAGPVALYPPAPPGVTTPAPDHCLVRGKLNERTGIDGKAYAIGYEVRLPKNWNGKFIFQGGGGVDGVLRLALGAIPSGTPQPNALSAGYASASADAGHLEESGPLGPYLFGLDPQARADKGYSSIPPVSIAAKKLITRFTPGRLRDPISSAAQTVAGSRWLRHNASPKCSTA